LINAYALASCNLTGVLFLALLFYEFFPKFGLVPSIFPNNYLASFKLFTITLSSSSSNYPQWYFPAGTGSGFFALVEAFLSFSSAGALCGGSTTVGGNSSGSSIGVSSLSWNDV